MASNSAVSVGCHLLLKMLKHGTPLSLLHDKGIVPPKMFTPEELKIYNFIRDHYKTYKELPSIQLALNHSDFKKYAHLKFTTDTVDAFIDKILERHMSSVLHTFAVDLSDSLTTASIQDVADLVFEAANTLKGIGRNAGYSGKDKIFTMSDAMKSALSFHDQRQRSYGIKGMSLGLPYIDYVTDGVYNGDFAAIIARPGKGKTYFLLNACMKAWLLHKQPGVIFSYEMPASQLGRRCLGLALETNTDPIKKGRLSTPFRKDINDHVTKLALYENDECPLYIVQGSMDSSLAFMEDIVFEKKPKWVGVDAAYIMRARLGRGHVSRTDNIADGAEGLKSLAMATDTSIIATYQYNRKGGGSLDNIMYSDTIGQVASLVFDIGDDKKASSKWSGIVSKVFTILKGRDGEQGSVRVLFDVLNSRISQAEVIFNSDTNMSQYQIEQMQSGYNEYMAATSHMMEAVSSKFASFDKSASIGLATSSALFD